MPPGGVPVPPTQPPLTSARADRGAGFSVGWLCWWFWVIVLAVEAVAGAEIPQR